MVGKTTETPFTALTGNVNRQYPEASPYVVVDPGWNLKNTHIVFPITLYLPDNEPFPIDGCATPEFVHVAVYEVQGFESIVPVAPVNPVTPA
jgi:hypothetical protein